MLKLFAVRTFQGACKNASLVTGKREGFLISKTFANPRPVTMSAVKPIAVGDTLPASTFRYLDGEGGVQTLTTDDVFKGKKVVLFAVPGAFTPTCSLKHLPGFIEKVDQFKAKGIDTVACVSVNDAFVMSAWGKSVGAEGKVTLLADGGGLFTKLIGLEQDLTEKGLGVRSKRYALYVDDLTVKVLHIDDAGLADTSAESMLAAIP